MSGQNSARYPAAEHEDVLSRTVRGRYGEGNVMGHHIPAYRHERDMPSDSKTELCCHEAGDLQHWRWTDVAFFLLPHTGKKFGGTNAQIVN